MEASMKNILLVLALGGALIPYTLYGILILQNPQLRAARGIISTAVFFASAALLWFIWRNPKLRGKQWMLTALTLAFTPACGLPLYFYFSLGAE